MPIHRRARSCGGLVVIDLLVRGRVSGTPLTDADAMMAVWSGLVPDRQPPTGDPRIRAS